MSLLTILQGDWIEQLRTLPDCSVHCCVTSPPYWQLRDYGVVGQLGLERTPEEYVAKIVEGFREVRRVLRDDGTIFVNLGDSYAWSCMTGGNEGINAEGGAEGYGMKRQFNRKSEYPGLKPKDLVGIPWMVAFALRTDGWYLRQDIIWEKANPMPESVTDRCTKSHEYIFLLAKNRKYFYDAEAIKEVSESEPQTRNRNAEGYNSSLESVRDRFSKGARTYGITRNKRSVWTVATTPYKEAHFATFPPDLIKPCILAGCPVGGTVLDPFAGSGTSGQVALELGRRAVLIELNPAYIELNPAYIELIHNRTRITPGLSLA